MAAPVEFLCIPRARGWEVHEIQALLGAWEELHVILRLGGTGWLQLGRRRRITCEHGHGHILQSVEHMET